MTKQECLNMMRLLSALESLIVYRSQNGHTVPDYIFDQITSNVEVLEREILK
jgi:hypothetical protein